MLLNTLQHTRQPYSEELQQVLESLPLMRCQRNLTLVYIRQPVVKLVSDTSFSFKVTEPINSIEDLMYLTPNVSSAVVEKPRPAEVLLDWTQVCESKTLGLNT